MEKFINEILENIKDELFSGVDSKFYDELLISYKKYLFSTLKNIKLTDDNYNKTIKIITEDNLNILKSYSPNFKLSLYIQDESYKKIYNLSMKGFNFALDKFNNNNMISINEANNYKNEMEKLLPDVYEFNYLSAMSLLSEGILDYDYACSDITYTSFRLANEINTIDRVEKKRNNLYN